MPYTFEGSNSKSYFLCQFIDMATPVKIIINKHAQGFSNRNLSDRSTINLGNWRICESIQPLP